MASAWMRSSDCSLVICAPGRIAVKEATWSPLAGDAGTVRVAAGQPGHSGNREQCFGGQRHPQASLCATWSLPGAIARPRGTVSTAQRTTWVTAGSYLRHLPERNDRYRRRGRRGPGDGRRAAPPGVHPSASSRPGRRYRELHRRPSRVRRPAGSWRPGSAASGDDHPPSAVADPAGDGGGAAPPSWQAARAGSLKPSISGSWLPSHTGSKKIGDMLRRSLGRCV